MCSVTTKLILHDKQKERKRISLCPGRNCGVFESRGNLIDGRNGLGSSLLDTKPNIEGSKLLKDWEGHVIRASII